MSDRELLELAAKAAGIDLYPQEVFTSGLTMRHGDGVLSWNPLVSDGDALRLAVRLSIHIEFSKPPRNPSADRVQASPMGAGHLAWVELHERDPYAATRRAIVRAAAEIGKSSS